MAEILRFRKPSNEEIETDLLYLEVLEERAQRYLELTQKYQIEFHRTQIKIDQLKKAIECD